MKRALLFLVAALALLGALALKGALLTLPSSPDTAFDATRAADRLARILGDQRPHPVDSDAGDAVRARLIAEMRAVGLNPRVTDDFACNALPRGRSVNCARVRNLVATIGPGEGRHLLLVSHYDSTSAGPGAADDGIGVATMLEIAALLRERRLTRPVSFLINEGEETGLLGARAFLERDPIAGRVEVAINLEARGVTGPAIMFETSRPNAAAIALYGAAPRPVANSLSTDLYALIPNSTDVSVFAERRPWTILNFAVIGNETRYHSMGDDLAALDRQSLQHMGDSALAVTERVLAGEVPAAAGDALYMDVLGRAMIAMPLAFGLVLLGISALFFAIECRRRRALGRPLLAMAAALAGSAALAFVGFSIVHWLRPGDFWRAYPLVTTSAVYASALAAAVAALLFVAGTAERTRLRAAFWLFFLLAGAAISTIAPGAAIYFLLPPLAAGFGMSGQRWFAWSERAGAILAILLLYLSFGPALGLFEELMNDDPPWIFAGLGAMILLPALIELMPLLKQARSARVAAGLAIGFWFAAALMPAYSPDRQQLFTIEYVWDEASRTGRYAVNNDGAPVPYGGAWERVEMPYTTRRRWAAPAPARAGLVAPYLEPVSTEPLADGLVRRRVRLEMIRANSAAIIVPADAGLKGAGVPGFVRRFSPGEPDDRYFLRCAGRACDGAEFDLVFAGNQVPELIVVGWRTGLAAVAWPLARARPAMARAQYGPDSTISIGRPGTIWAFALRRRTP